MQLVLQTTPCSLQVSTLPSLLLLLLLLLTYSIIFWSIIFNGCFIIYLGYYTGIVSNKITNNRLAATDINISFIAIIVIIIIIIIIMIRSFCLQQCCQIVCLHMSLCRLEAFSSSPSLITHHHHHYYHQSIHLCLTLKFALVLQYFLLQVLNLLL